MDGIESMIPKEKRHISAAMGKNIKEVMSGKVIPMPTHWKGYRFIPGFIAETAKFAYEKYEYEPRSVFVITFPKTGTHWCAEVMREIMYGHDAELKTLTKAIPTSITVLERGVAEKFEILPYLRVGRKLFTSHLPEELVNLDKIKKCNGKVIIVLRNPKDQAVSWFHFIEKNPFFDGIRDEMDSDWSGFLSDYMQGKHPIITKKGEWYPDYILGWYRRKDDPNVLFVYFEDMKKDIKKEIRKMAHFVGIELTDERVDEIAASTTFSKMKADTLSDKTEATPSLLKAINAKLMRKGQVGGWKEVFTVAQSEMMDKVIAEKLGETDIKFTYEL